MTRATRLLAPLLLLAATLFLVLFAGACLEAPCGEAHHQLTLSGRVVHTVAAPAWARGQAAEDRALSAGLPAAEGVRLAAPAPRPAAGPELLRI